MSLGLSKLISLKPCHLSKEGNLTLIPNFLTPEQCETLTEHIDRGELETLTNRKRLIVENKSWANQLWESMNASLLSSIYATAMDEFGDKWECCGFNDRFRLIKYNPGDSFALHEDGVYHCSWNERSFATFMIYLNDVTEENGGATCFSKCHLFDHDFKIQPRQGLCVIFFVDNLLHCGEELKDGHKYLFRTDIMYHLIKAKDMEERRTMHEILMTTESGDNEDNIALWKKYYELKKSYMN